MAEAKVCESEQEAVLTLEEMKLPAAEETQQRVLYPVSGAEKPEDESDSVRQPLLQLKHQATDGADQETSVPLELELAGRDQLRCNGSVRTLCSDSSRHECPICSELFDSHGEHRLTLLNCSHALCHHCIAGILRQAKDPGRLQCPFCRQTTPFPQWEIQRLQDESYHYAVYEPGPSFVSGPGLELEAPFSLETNSTTCGCCLVRGLTLMEGHYLCLSVTVVLLFLLLLLGCLLYMVVPLIMASVVFGYV